MVPGETPKDSFTNYIEVFRVVDGTAESKPCIKAFLNGGSMALAVIDIDQEKDKLGFGLPDAVERISESDLASEQMIARLYPNGEEYKRQEPKHPSVRADIAPAGTEIDVWETSTDPKGWRVPFTYKNDDKDNYRADVKFKEYKHGDESHSQKLREVEYIEKHWSDGHGVGPVVEYFTPKSPFNQKVVRASAQTYGEPRLDFVFEDGNERSGVLTPGANQFIGDAPQMIAFTLGEKRYQIKDFDGDGIYEKRREVTEESSPMHTMHESYGGGDAFGSDLGKYESPSVPQP